QALGDAERHTPYELARVDVDGRQLSPGRLLAHHVRRVVAEASAAGHAAVRTVGIDPVAGTLRLRGTGLVHIAIAQTGELPDLVRVDEQVTQLRVERDAAPVHAAVVAGKLQPQPVVRHREIRPAELYAFDQLPARRFELRRHCRDVAGRDRHARQRRGLDGKRLRLRRALERNVALRNRALLDAID